MDKLSTWVEIDKLTRYMWIVVVIVGVTMFFFAYDLYLVVFTLPFFKETFNATTPQLSTAISIIGLGALLSFVIPMAADRWGRKPVFLLSLTGFTVMTGLTAFTNSLFQWTVCQTLVSFFMMGEQILCHVIIAEEWPARLRGRGIAIELSAGGLGVLSVALLLPYCLKQSWLGVGQGWRIMYLIGLIPLIALGFFVLKMKETRRFQYVKTSLAHRGRQYSKLFRKGYRKYMFILIIAWIGFQVSNGTLAFTQDFTSSERGWTPQMISLFGIITAGMAFLGINFSGWMMDKMGRRWAVLVIQLSLCIFSTLFYILPAYPQMLLCGLIFGFFGNTVALLNVLNAEFFPTEIRSTGAAWAVGISRLAYIASPAFFGYVTTIGYSRSEGLIMTGLPWYLLTMIVLLIFLPETKRRVLEEIVEKEVKL